MSLNFAFHPCCKCQSVTARNTIMTADVTAKGESVANMADIGGTITGIMLSRSRLAMVPVFCVLSVGYLFASRKEVGSVQLPYLNRQAHFTFWSTALHHYVLTLLAILAMA